MSLEWAHVRSLSFDCYGTLIDWEAGLMRSFATLLSADASQLDRADLLHRFAVIEQELEEGPYRKYREILVEVARRIAGDLKVEVSEADAQRFAASLQEWEPFPDTVAALQELKRRFRLIILSNVDRDLFAGTNRKLGVEFDDIITAEDVGAYKPSPRNFEALLNVVDRDSHVHVAQSLFHDHAPAQAMGIRSVWINRYRLRGGAVPRAEAPYDLELPDLRSVAERTGV